MFLSELSVGSYFSVPSKRSQRHPALPVFSPARVLRFQSLGSLVSSLLASDSIFMVLLSCLPSIHLLSPASYILLSPLLFSVLVDLRFLKKAIFCILKVDCVFNLP